MSLIINTELTIRPGVGQSQAEAEAEFAQLFTEYLTQTDGAFQTDYGPNAWGGYDGPTVTSVIVRGPGEPANTAPSGSGNERKTTFVH